MTDLDQPDIPASDWSGDDGLPMESIAVPAWEPTPERADVPGTVTTPGSAAAYVSGLPVEMLPPDPPPVWSRPRFASPLPPPVYVEAPVGKPRRRTAIIVTLAVLLGVLTLVAARSLFTNDTKPSAARPPATAGGPTTARAPATTAPPAPMTLPRPSTPSTLPATSTASGPPTTGASSPTTAASSPTSAAGGGGGGGGSLTGTLDIQAVLAKVAHSVVAIEITESSTTAGGGQPIAAGSGVVISNDGLVLTNAHVVNATGRSGTAGSTEVSIKLPDGTLRAAKVLGTATKNDVALVRVTDPSGLEPVVLGDSDQLKVGDDVLAIGNALDLGASPTVTKGIVSAKNRTLDVDATLTLTGLIQTDAAINEGNSGGALLNARAELVGINSAGIPNAQNLGFAIAINTIKPLLPTLEAGTSVTASTTAFLGVSIQQTVDGATVTGVSAGSGAEAAGVQVGDVVTAIDGQAVVSDVTLGAAIKSHKPGDVITITVKRNGASVDLRATLGSR